MALAEIELENWAAPLAADGSRLFIAWDIETINKPRAQNAAELKLALNVGVGRLPDIALYAARRTAADDAWLLCCSA